MQYLHVVAALEEDTVMRVLDILTQPQAMNKYTKLKDRLVNTFQCSEWEVTAKILEKELDDSKLSELMGKTLALVTHQQLVETTHPFQSTTTTYWTELQFLIGNYWLSI